MHFNPAAGIPGMYPPGGPLLPITAAYNMIRHGAPMKPGLPIPQQMFNPQLHNQAKSSVNNDVQAAVHDHSKASVQDQPKTVPAVNSIPVQEQPKTTSATDVTPQMSPDVNSNTQLMCMQKTVEKETLKTPDECSGKSEAMKVDKVIEKVRAELEEKIEPGNDEKMAQRLCESKEDDSEKDGSGQCRHCGDKFASAVEQHQHERYLCKSNRDIVPRVAYSDSSRNSPCSVISEGSHHGNTNGSNSGMETDGEDGGEELYKEEATSESKKFRMRSLINDEQLAVLKSYYQMNPRPRKYELIRIGNEIGFSKRVVQVWFQNMRARDRRQGKNVPYFPSMARFKRQESPSAPWKENKPVHGYIPVIPNPTLAHNGKPNGLVTSPKPKVTDEQPLDLSVKSSKPSDLATSSPVSATHPSSSHSSNGLCFTSKAEERKPVMPPTFQDSPIFKYMQQEGLFARPFLGHSAVPNMMPGHSVPSTMPNMMHPIFAAHLFPRPDHFMMHTPDPRAKMAAATPTSRSDDGKTSDQQNGNHSNSESSNQDGPSRNLVIDESPDESSNMSSSDDSDDMESHYAHAATLNLATLAEVSLSRAAALMDGSLKSKRLRKKSWRQVQGYVRITCFLTFSCS